MIQNQLGISGEPSKGIIYEDSDEGITLKYDPNTQFITFWKDGVKYDQKGLQDDKISEGFPSGEKSNNLLSHCLVYILLWQRLAFV